ncbi:Lrp/AsnC family transcriptional regulator [Gordonia jinhuaensis]|uniref:AsnC family transcriptional regulator n=1 Tax=Gordonia jinhuaensis TaxID=1517702 RepID=A0A916TBE6_9ACTN|nr:Lrp/AsnC family transcriptional regulator [Gordonia jinhuaensis]GGB37253.1 AsnC family transcriptional regulator [Gordonia jinhuaensis]
MDLDARLLDALRRDGRLSVTDLAREVGSVRGVVSARLNALRADGSVVVVAAVHPDLLGLSSFAHVSVRTTGRTTEIGEQIAGMAGAVFVSAIGGDFQLVVELQLTGPGELYDAIASIRAMSDVATVDTLIYLEVLKGVFLPRGSLPRDLSLDSRDITLIGLLQRDGRASYAALAAQVGLSASATRARVTALIDAGAVRIAPVFRRTHPGDGVIAGIGLNLRGTGENVLSALVAEPSVEYVARTFGRFDAVATVAARSPGDLHRRLDRLSGAPEVAAVHTWVHLHVHKERYEWPLVVAADR